MSIVQLAREAMATRFELVLHGTNSVALRAAGEEALDEIDRLESQLSLYRTASDIARVNARAAFEPVPVAPLVFQLLKQARDLQLATGGAFDVTIAPLVRCWGFMGGTGALPDPNELAIARQKIGMHHVILDEANLTVRFDQPGVMLDLGAIGKGLAIDRAAEFLREAGVTRALIHGGTSTIFAMGEPLDADAWKVSINSPSLVEGCPVAEAGGLLATVVLRNEALSVSAVWGRSFHAGGKTFGHVLDPRTGEPVSGTLLSAVALPSATESDALSTALLVLGPDGMEKILKCRPETRSLVVVAEGTECRDYRRGL